MSILTQVMMTQAPLNSSFNQTGYTLLCEYVPHELVVDLCAATEKALSSEHAAVLRAGGQAYGIRDLLRICPSVLEFCRLPEINHFVSETLGAEFGAVRGLFFDKPPGRGWTLPWHRDRTIAVSGIPSDCSPFTNPTVKAGIPHLTAPIDLLNQMLTLRLSLDDMNAENGPLVVLPGSHRVSVDDSGGIGEKDDDLHALRSASFYQQQCAAGDIFAMRPLLAHSSLNVEANCSRRRRVIHIEICSRKSPGEGLQWRDYIPLSPASAKE